MEGTGGAGQEETEGRKDGTGGGRKRGDGTGESGRDEKIGARKFVHNVINNISEIIRERQ